MRIGRTLPPSAAPLYFSDLWSGFMGFFFGGRYLRKLEIETEEYFGVKHVFFVSSGKAALYLILRALKSLRPLKDEVVIPAYTCFSVPSAIVKAGLKTSLCDIEASTLDFNHDLLEDVVNNNTLCVIPDDLLGVPADMDRIVKLCREKDIFIVEDAAQAMGGTYKGKLLGTIGDVGLFSLGRGKVITCGSGGIILTNDDGICAAIEKECSALETPGVLESIKEFFSTILLSVFVHPSLYWFPAGLPFLHLGETIFYKDFPVKCLSGMKAGLMKNWIGRLEEAVRDRANNAKDLADSLGLKMNGETAIPYLRLPLFGKDVALDQLVDKGARSLGVTGMYPAPVSEIDDIRPYLGACSFDVAKLVAEKLLTLPTHKFLTWDDKRKLHRLCENLQLTRVEPTAN